MVWPFRNKEWFTYPFRIFLILLFGIVLMGVPWRQEWKKLTVLSFRNIYGIIKNPRSSHNGAFLKGTFIFLILMNFFCCYYFKAMNFQGRLKYLHGQKKKGKDGSILPPQLALFAIATPLQPPSILEIRTKNFIFRTKHKLDFTPIGCDAK